MAFTFDDMHSELSELMLIQVQNIDVLKSRSQLFRNILCKHDNTDNSLINVDYHVNYFINELPAFVERTTIVECNRLLVKDLGDKTKMFNHFKNNYALRFLIVTFHYYGCDNLQKWLIHLIEETPERCLTKIMKLLIKSSENSDSIKTFVEKVTMKLK